MSKAEKDLVQNLSAQMTSKQALQAFEESLKETGLVPDGPLVSLGGEQGMAASPTARRISKKLEATDSTKFTGARVSQFGRAMLQRLDRQYSDQNSRVNLIFRVVIGVLVIQALVILGAVILLFMDRVKLTLIKGVSGFSPGIIGGITYAYYQSERKILDRIEKERSLLYSTLLKGEGVTRSS
jgi:hypothetical protein